MWYLPEQKTEGNIISEPETDVGRESGDFSKLNIVQNQINIKKEIMPVIFSAARYQLPHGQTGGWWPLVLATENTPLLFLVNNIFSLW